MPFRRIRDGQMVPDSEACDANGTVKDGYAASFSYGQRFIQAGDSLSFDIMMLDSASRSTMLTDAEQTNAVARAEMIHRTSTAYLGDRAPAFTDKHAALAIQKAEADVVRLRANMADSAAGAEQARARCEAARNKMIADLNSWRR